MRVAQRELEGLGGERDAEAVDAAKAHQKQIEELTEAEKEKRVAHLGQMAARRMGQAGLANGWSVWQEQWEEAARQKRMLAAAGARLQRPALTASFGHWRGDWRKADHEAEVVRSLVRQHACTAFPVRSRARPTPGVCTARAALTKRLR